MKNINKGNLNGRYKEIGSIVTLKSNYKLIKVDEHKWVPLHRYLVEKYLCYKLKKRWLIHHIDGDGLNNILENLYIFKTKQMHYFFEILIKQQEINRNILKSNLENFKER